MSWVSVSWVVSIGMAYLIGSIPSAYLAGRLAGGRDIRDEGDRNPGAGNAFRTIGPKVGLMVGVVDVGKGAVAVLMAKALTGSAGAGMAAGAIAVVGHNWPIFLQLRGGRGAASTVGVFLALVPIPAIPMSLVCLALLPIIRSATLALGLMMVPMPLLVWLTGSSTYLVVYSVALPVMVGIRHYLTSRNVRRLKEGQAPGLALPQE